MENKDSFLRDDSPYSTMRIAVIFIIALFMPWFVYVWVVISLKTVTVAVIPESVQWLLGIPLSIKTAQKALEMTPNIVSAIKGTLSKSLQEGTTQQ